MPQYIGYMPTGTANSSVTASSLTDIYTSLYLNMDGANNSTTFTDLSPNALTITPNDNSHISTVQSKFGGASVFLDGTGEAIERLLCLIMVIRMLRKVSGRSVVQVFVYIHRAVALGTYQMGKLSAL